MLENTDKAFKMDNSEKLAQDEVKHNIICVGHHYMHTKDRRSSYISYKSLRLTWVFDLNRNLMEFETVYEHSFLCGAVFSYHVK
jgi:hypothetical protein